MFVGEAPGADEDRLGRPFVGAAGRKLDDIIKAMGFKREQVYIANVLKARPPENRTPQPDEVAAHGPFLVEQILAIRPRVIVALGRPAAHFLLESTAPISRLRGIWGTWRHEDVSIDVMPTFHPAYLLRQYTPEVRGQVWNDMQQVLERLQRASE
ncbi:MAG: uracil-DNA glycosylase [Phycisphaerales bacterium]|nr:uracil-DNA glycosylase [Phycisphaerales bacterium]